MEDVLIQFLRGFKELTQEQVQELAGCLTVIEASKNKTLVEVGEKCQLCYFILKGCLRQYVIQDGIDKTIAIYTEYQSVNYFTNQGCQNNLETCLTSVEDSVLIVGDPEKDQEMFTRFPVLAEITRKMMAADFGKTQNDLAKVIISGPEQRYLNLLEERPDILQRLPQHIIASYLGMTPESLSRIRKRITKRTNNT